MTSGRFAAPLKPRPLSGPVDGTIPPNPADTHREKNATIVLIKIGLRAGDNNDILEALGLIPTTPAPQPANPPTFCTQCAWRSTKTSNPPFALKAHMRTKHKVTW